MGVCPDRRCSGGRVWLTKGLAGIALLLCTASATAVEDNWFFLRHHNPFLQIYGLPPFQTAALVADAELQYRASFDIANHSETIPESPDGTLIIDGESYFFTLSMRYGLKQWLEIGFDLPFIRHSTGVFDNAIERWHKIWGFSNAERTRPSNELLFRYERQGSPPFELTTPISGIGDLQLTAAMPLLKGGSHAVSLRSSLKLPTGDEQDLLGSGATDFSLGLYASKTGIFSLPDLSVSGFAGMLWLGEGEVFADIQKSNVLFGGLAGAWQATDNLSVAAQVYVQGKYLESELRDIGGDSVQASFGGTYTFADRNICLSVALVEDLVTDTVSDVALHFSVTWYGGNPRSASR